MFKSKPLTLAMRCALSGAAVASTLVTPPALSQEGAAQEMVITGSRIRRADLESPSPVSVVDRSDIIATGMTDVGDLVQRMPAMSGSPIGTTTNNGGTGAVEVDLRGLGTDRTLTLINGQRLVDGGDYQTIPAVMIDRVEILKDGASAVYGADAVAGVVNIITRSNFEGLEVNVQTTDWFDTDGAGQDAIDFIAGTNFDGGNFMFGAEYVEQEEAFQSDAPWDFFQDSYYIYPEGCEAHPAAPYNGTPDGGCYPLGSSRIEEGWMGFASGDVYMNEDGSGLVPYDGRTYNFAPINYAQTPYERFNIFAEGNFDLTDTVQFNAALRANFRESAQQLAPLPYDSRPGLDPGYVGTWPGLGEGGTVGSYSGISEENFYLVEAATAAGLPIEPVVDARRRMSETNRRFEQDVDQWQGVFGLTGTLGNDMDWEATYNKGYRSRTDKDSGQFFGTFLANALGPSADLDGDGTPECYSDLSDDSTLIEGCVPMNMFGGPGSVTQEMIDYVAVELIDTYKETHDILDVSLTGSGFELPGGALGWAVGAGWWDQSYEYNPDSAKSKGVVTGNKGAGTDGELENVNAYVELFAPVLESVSVTGGVRYDDYDAFGSDTTWQLGVEYQATDSLKLRATTGTVFRAPTIDDLFGGLIDSFVTYSDPCVPTGGAALAPGCDQLGVQDDSQAPSKIGGNPNLQPETGDTFTVGAVWTSEVGGGDLSVTLDYWETEIEEGISSLGAQFILDDCYVNLNADSCALVTRRPDYSVGLILDSQVNVAEQGASGIDLETRYTFDTDMGTFDVSFLWAHLLERTKVPFPGAEEIDLAGRYTDVTAEDGGGYSENKISYSLGWTDGPMSLTYLGEYISELDADTFCNCMSDPYIQHIEYALYHDLVGSYEFNTGTTLSLSVTNLTDEEPPYIEIGFNATTEPSNYRMFGRGWWLRLQQSF